MKQVLLDDASWEELVRSLVGQGRITEARAILEIAGEAVPLSSKLREALAPPKVTRSNKKGRDRTAEFHWLATKSSEYRGKWVALLGEELLAAGDSLKAILSRLDALRPAGEPLIHHLD